MFADIRICCIFAGEMFNQLKSFIPTMNQISLKEVEDKIVIIRNQQVILDYDVADLYGVKTKEINQAVKNNPKKFPPGYVFPVTNEDLRSNFLTTNKMTRVTPKAFTERGLYMLATILKGDKAIDTSISIIETYAKLRELSQAISKLSANPEQTKQKSLMQKSGEIMADLFGDAMETSETETEIELNFAVVKLKHKVKRKDKNK